MKKTCLPEDRKSTASNRNSALGKKATPLSGNSAPFDGTHEWCQGQQREPRLFKHDPSHTRSVALRISSKMAKTSFSKNSLPEDPFPSPSPSTSIVSLLASPSPSSSSPSSSSSSSSSFSVSYLSSHSPASPTSSPSSSSSSSSSSSLSSNHTSSSVSSPSAESLPSAASASSSSSSSSSSLATSASGDLPEDDGPFLVDYQNTMAGDHTDKFSIIISPDGYLGSGSLEAESGQGPLPEGPEFSDEARYPAHEAPMGPQPPGDRGNVVPGPPVLYIGTATIHAEEIGLVLLVLLLWVGAITLFINRWGKLRMLEPYQPAYTAPPSPHRHSSAAQGPCINIQSTSELSLAENAAGGGVGTSAGSSSSYHPHHHHHHYHHHHNSISGPSDYLGPYGPSTGRGGSLAGGMLGVARSPSTLSVYHLNPQRKVKSAVDLVSLVMQEKMNTSLHLAATNV